MTPFWQEDVQTYFGTLALRMALALHKHEHLWVACELTRDLQYFTVRWAPSIERKEK